MVRLIVKGSEESTPAEPTDETDRVYVTAGPLSGIAVNCHLCSMFDVLHVSSSGSPIWHAGAIPEGKISTTPER